MSRPFLSTEAGHGLSQAHFGKDLRQRRQRQPSFLSAGRHECPPATEECSARSQVRIWRPLQHLGQLAEQVVFTSDRSGGRSDSLSTPSSLSSRSTRGPSPNGVELSDCHPAHPPPLGMTILHRTLNSTPLGPQSRSRTTSVHRHRLLYCDRSASRRFRAASAFGYSGSISRARE